MWMPITMMRIWMRDMKIRTLAKRDKMGETKSLMKIVMASSLDCIRLAAPVKTDRPVGRRWADARVESPLDDLTRLKGGIRERRMPLDRGRTPLPAVAAYPLHALHQPPLPTPGEPLHLDPPSTTLKEILDRLSLDALRYPKNLIGEE